MSDQVGKRIPRKAKPTYISSILMTSLVLFILGLSGMIWLHFQAFTSLVKENIQVSVYFSPNDKEADILQTRKRLEIEPFIKRIEYVSRDQALQNYINRFEEDPTQLLDYNPLPASLDLFLTADYMNPDSISVVESLLQDKYGFLPAEIKTDRKLITAVDRDLGKAGLVIGLICLVLLVIVVLMIDSTVRLAMYSNRFLIRNMQLVGANRWFILKPYALRALFNGLISGIMAGLAVLVSLYLARKYFPDLELLEDLLRWGLLLLTLILLGMFISWFSTLRSVNRYLKMKLDELY